MTEKDEDAAPEERHSLPSGLIHEMRTPLNQIIGYSELLMEQAEDAGHDASLPHLRKVRAAGYQLLDLINHHFLSVRNPEVCALPKAENSASAAAAAGSGDRRGAPRGSAAATPHGSLLVVDDVDANRDLLCRRLQRQGYEVTSAAGGPQALEILQTQPVDLVLLNIGMPGMDGYEVLRRIKADDRLHEIPVIMISALNELNSVVRCIEMGAEDYLPMPFHPTLLKARIGGCLEKKWARERELRLPERGEESAPVPAGPTRSS